MLPARRDTVVCAHVAQSVEHLHGKEKVIGSIPIVGSTRSTPLQLSKVGGVPGGAIESRIVGECVRTA